MPPLLNSRIRIVRGAVVLAAMLGVGTAWYVVIEGFTVLEAAYMVVVTVSTVGYEEVRPLDTSGRLFTMALIFTGVGLVLYLAVSVVEDAVTGRIGEALGWQRMSRRIDRMHDHVVVCGFGRVGREIASELQERGEEVVVVDRDASRTQQARDTGLLAVLGDATEESALRTAHVETARVLVAASDSDAGNTFIALTARALNAELMIIARAGSESAEQRLLTAGANRVLSPYRLAGRRMALAAVQPMMVDFLDSLYHSGSPGLLAEFAIEGDTTALAGATLAEAFDDLGTVRVLGLLRADGQLVVAPGGGAELALGDRVIVYGEQGLIESLSASRRARIGARNV